jgi:hypothetical protein
MPDIAHTVAHAIERTQHNPEIPQGEAIRPRISQTRSSSGSSGGGSGGGSGGDSGGGSGGDVFVFDVTTVNMLEEFVADTLYGLVRLESAKSLQISFV